MTKECHHVEYMKEIHKNYQKQNMKSIDSAPIKLLQANFCPKINRRDERPYMRLQWVETLFIVLRRFVA